MLHSDNIGWYEKVLVEAVFNKYGTRTGVAKLMFDQLNCDHLRDGHSPRDSDHPRIVWLQSLEW